MTARTSDFFRNNGKCTLNFKKLFINLSVVFNLINSTKYLDHSNLKWFKIPVENLFYPGFFPTFLSNLCYL